MCGSDNGVYYLPKGLDIDLDYSIGSGWLKDRSMGLGSIWWSIEVPKVLGVSLLVQGSLEEIGSRTFEDCLSGLVARC